MEGLEQMRARLDALNKDGRAIFQAAHAENRDPTEAECAKIEDLAGKFDALQKAIACRERVEEQSTYLDSSTGRPLSPAVAKPATEVGPGPAIPNQGWKSMGQFLQAVRVAGTDGGIDPRLMIKGAATTWSSEAVGADGGFLVPTEFSQEVMKHAIEENALLPLTNPTPIAGNSMVFPRSETTPWGTTGVIAYWESEANTATETKVAVGRTELRLSKLMAAAPVTDELLSDTTALEAHITEEAGKSIRYKINDAIVNGNGSGKPLGFVVGGSLVTQTKETSQTADTIVAANLTKMFARMPAGLLSSAVWLINPDAWNQLPLMVIGQQPVWTAPNQGMQQAPGGIALGRPVMMQEQCQTLGDAGDIYFFGPGGYKTIVKSAGVTMALSVEYYFLQDIPVFKFKFRMDGKPKMTAAITPPNSTVTQSPFVRMEARA